MILISHLNSIYSERFSKLSPGMTIQPLPKWESSGQYLIGSHSWSGNNTRLVLSIVLPMLLDDRGWRKYWFECGNLVCSVDHVLKYLRGSGREYICTQQTGMILAWQYTTIYNIEEWLSSRATVMIIQQYTRLVWYYRWCYWILFVMFIPKKHVRTNRIVIYEKDYVSYVKNE